MSTTMALLCQLRAETLDWQEALSGEREGLDEICEAVDRHLDSAGERYGYGCECGASVPLESQICHRCGKGKKA